MMSEIEKLMQNAELLYCNKCRHDSEIDCIYMCESKYPPFTAEKQLELIKWCIDNYRGEIFDTIETEWFEEQLSAYINNLWQDLTEEEKTEIKEIVK